MSAFPGEPTEPEWLRDDLRRVPLRTPTIPPATRTNAYLLETDAGWWAFDPGPPEAGELGILLRAIDDLPGGSGSFAGWVLTHHHPDHWGGLARAIAALPRPLVLHEASEVRRTADSAGWEVWAPERFDSAAGGAELRHTPGHSSDHLVAWLPGGDIIAGDLVAGVGTVVINPPDGHMGDYLRSLEALLEGRGGEPAGRLFPAHGPTVDDGSALLRQYVAHRLERERQVVDALEAHGGSAAPEDLVPRIYADVPTYLYPVAARSVLAHLEKLEEESRAEREGSRWRLL